MLLFAESLDHALAHEHDYEEDLIAFALHRSGLRTRDEHAALFRAAGLAEPEHTTVGWGYSLYAVAPGGSD